MKGNNEQKILENKKREKENKDNIESKKNLEKKKEMIDNFIINEEKIYPNFKQNHSNYQNVNYPQNNGKIIDNSNDIEPSNVKYNYMKLRKSRIPTKLVNVDFLENNEMNQAGPPIKNIINEKKRKKINQNMNILQTNRDISNKSSTRNINIKNQNLINSGDIDKNLNDNNFKKKEKKEKNKHIYLTDYEMNILLYKQALKIDKRTYFQYYLSLIKTKHIIIFTFMTFNDYNSLIIKISFFFFSFTLYFTTNTLFFNDSTIDKISDDGGSFNLEYQIPQIFYSSLISSVINSIVKTICLTDKNIIQLKNEISKKNFEKKKLLTLDCILIKSIIYFVSTFVLLLFFWYYLSCFCSVYKNTQIHLIKDTLISYGLSMIYPFAIYLFPGMFRIPALRNTKANGEKMYKFSKILQLI